MKKGFLVVSLCLLILVVAFVNVGSASAASSCPPWLVIPGICLTDQGQVQIENVPTSEGYYLQVDYDWSVDRSLVSAAIIVPDLPVVLGAMNFNKFRLEVVSVFVDQRPGYRNIYFIGHLKCDSQGSLQPTIAFSIPKQVIPPGSTYFGIDNWLKAMTTACKY